MAQKLFKGISVITAGPALGHGMVIDADTLEQVVRAGNDLGQVKVLSDHSSSVSNIIGYLENFTLDGGRVRADLTLFESHEGFAYFSELIGTLPGQIGFSISFSGVPRMAEDGTQLADVSTLYSVDLVTTPAANPTGVYSARVDTRKSLNMDTTVKESAPVIEAAPEAPAAPAFNAEQAIAALSARIDELVGKFAAKFEAVVEEAPAVAEAPVAEEAPAVAEAPAPEAKADLESNDKIVALETKLARLTVELEASKGTQPVEISEAKPLSRNELLAKFNAEKDPRRAAEIFNQIKLAR
jgi:phage head maturation protease